LSNLEILVLTATAVGTEKLDGLIPEIANLSYVEGNVLQEIHLHLTFEEPATTRTLLTSFESLQTSVSWAGLINLRRFSIKVRIVVGPSARQPDNIEELETETRTKFSQLGDRFSVEFTVDLVVS